MYDRLFLFCKYTMQTWNMSYNVMCAVVVKVFINIETEQQPMQKNIIYDIIFTHIYMHSCGKDFH